MDGISVESPGGSKEKEGRGVDSLKFRWKHGNVTRAFFHECLLKTLSGRGNGEVGSDKMPLQWHVPHPKAVSFNRTPHDRHKCKCSHVDRKAAGRSETLCLVVWRRYYEETSPADPLKCFLPRTCANLYFCVQGQKCHLHFLSRIPVPVQLIDHPRRCQQDPAGLKFQVLLHKKSPPQHIAAVSQDE